MHLKRRGYLSIATVAMACMALMLLSGCKHRLSAKQMTAAKGAAVNAGNQFKSGMKAVQAAVSDDDSLVAGPQIVNINYANMKRLMTLPGVSEAKARQIMDNRPYNTPQDLVYKKVLTKAEFARVEKRVDAWDNLWNQPE